jgi:16S rRNA (uracil1498-N3)-methyltransferase
MARRRFFVEEIRDGKAALEGDEARHLTQVLRVEAGETYEICDNEHIYVAKVDVARKQHVVFTVSEQLPDPDPLPPIKLLIALIKFERLELLLEKATELGVGSVQLVRSERSEKGLESAAEKRIIRWRRIVLEASQQSRRARMPEILRPISFHQALRSEAASRLLLDEQRDGVSILKAVADPNSSVAALVGPEGGWTDLERSQAREAGWIPISLGTQVLRTETAAIAALAVLSSMLAHPA